MITADRTALWYKDAVIYAVDVGTYMDSDGDGIGDFEGLRMRLDYIAALGVTCLWLLPFYPTPNHDNGYDITDYYGIDPRLGTMGDCVAFMHEAHARGLSVIVDLVVHHTSDQHPWFQQARSGGRFRDYYVWTDDPPEQTSAEVIFPGDEESVWAWDDEAGASYLHQFYRFQPDLDITNPGLRRELQKIIGMWLQIGADGFRVDAASRMLGREALQPEPAEQPHEFLRHLRSIVTARNGQAALMAESDVDVDALASFFGDGDEMHLLYNFWLDNFLFLALARGKAEPIARALEQLPDKPAVAQWANFVRNLDELDLERLSDSEQHEVYAAFAPERNMRIYDRGIRRRLAPMLGGDQRRIEMVYSLLFSLPGTPVTRLRRRDRHGRRSLAAGAIERAHADAVVRRAQRRLLDRERGQPEVSSDQRGTVCL